MPSKILITNGKYIDYQLANGVPEGGTTGQILAKASNNDYDVVWSTGGGSGGGNVPDVTSITASSPLTGGTITTTGTIGISKATTSVDGYLSATDWSTFNSKEPAISSGTTSQYWRGDKTWQTFPTIPTVTPSALTKTDDTNVTLTLGGTPNTSLLQSVSLTLGWTGTLDDSRITSASTWNAKQNALNGTGFVKASGTTISYDNSTYITSVGTGVTNELTYWSGTNSIGSLTTATYPSLTELSYVKGATSSLQTQLGAKQDLSLSAYSFRANNTASTANATNFTFREVASQTLSSGITWNGTPPSGTQTHRYRWNQIGNLVTFYATLLYSTVGANNTQLTLVLPADLPIPFSPTGLTSANNMLYYGAASIMASATTIITTARSCMLRRNTANTGYEIIVTQSGAVGVTYASITIQYFTN